jgi:Holliday junction resolvase RusA-like endonuclease
MSAAQTTQPPRRYILTFDWTSPPLTANQRLHWRKKADITRKVRAAAERDARDIPYLDKIRVGMTWVVRTQHRRDVDNTVPTLKALCDGLVDADIVPDDIPELMAKTMPEIRYAPNEAQRIELWIEAIA